MPRRSEASWRKLGPPSQLEVIVLWIVGFVTTIASGGVAIYASHHPLWRGATETHAHNPASRCAACHASLPHLVVAFKLGQYFHAQLLRVVFAGLRELHDFLEDQFGERSISVVVELQHVAHPVEGHAHRFNKFGASTVS